MKLTSCNVSLYMAALCVTEYRQVLKIRGLMFRDVDPSGKDHNRHTKRMKRADGTQMQQVSDCAQTRQSEDTEAKRRVVATEGSDPCRRDASATAKDAKAADDVEL